MKICFHINGTKSDAMNVLAGLESGAVKYGLEITSARSKADVVVALGGDGTILRAVHEFAGLPILGLNIGGLGYLSSVERRDFEKALRMLAEGRYSVQERSMLCVRKSGGRRIKLALNDVVITREMTGHAAILDLKVDGKSATRYMADGLIIATPTGSTAYSLAAGGPVVMPETNSFVVTPMNPHALGSRAIVVGDGAKLKVCSMRRTASSAEKLGVYADGESVMMLSTGESVEISKAPAVARLVALEGYDPYEVLGRKLGWSGTSIK